MKEQDIKEILDRLKVIEDNTKKPHWFRTFISFILLSFGLIIFNLEGTKFLEGILGRFNFSSVETSIIATLMIFLSLFLYRR